MLFHVDLSFGVLAFHNGELNKGQMLRSVLLRVCHERLFKNSRILAPESEAPFSEKTRLP